MKKKRGYKSLREKREVYKKGLGRKKGTDQAFAPRLGKVTGLMFNWSSEFRVRLGVRYSLSVRPCDSL